MAIRNDLTSYENRTDAILAITTDIFRENSTTALSLAVLPT